MTDCLFGVETEYAIGGGLGQEGLDRFATVRELLELAHRSCRNVPDEISSGMFLENGARFYLDSGNHPEISTPECSNPWDAVRYVEAGHAFLSRLNEEANRKAEEKAGVYRVNVNYAGSAATWGCHESYLHRSNPASLPADLIPHLVTRIVYTGAGGFDPFSPGLRFTLSPRASFVENTISAEAAEERGIFHTKNEPLCSGYNRLHVTFGENLCSHCSMFVKVGATSLVLAMAQAGLNPGRDVRLKSPLSALRIVSTDTGLSSQVQLEDRSQKSAIEIQRHYLALAEENAGRDFMPHWTAAVCVEWRRILDLLSEGPQAAARSIDWCMKWALYSNYASQCGLDWQSLGECSDLLASTARHLGASLKPDQPFPFDALFVVVEAEPELKRTVDSELSRLGVSIDDLKRMFQMRAELLEIDTRFGQLGPEGVFSQLDAAGVLNHRVRGVDNIRHAIENPPIGSRASLRGAVIKRIAGDLKGRWNSSWHHIYSPVYGRRLDLSNPFALDERWHDIEREDPNRVSREQL
jgi:proteasome accessory factor A